ncbi:hypothetical protein MMC17_010260 [Xylographa soralifera]|nr:hypothetical protein [Xylographa soralifera]
MVEDATPSKMSTALHYTIARDQMADIEATETQLPTLLSEKLHIDQAEENSNRSLMGTSSPGGNAAPPSENDRRESPQLDRQQMMQHDRNISPGTPAAQRTNAANPGIDLSMQYGINSSYLTPAQLELFQTQKPQVQEHAFRVYAPNIRAQQERQSITQAGISNQGSSTIQPRMNGGMLLFYGPTIPVDTQALRGQALQDYSTQLMLLEQQNKKRLLIARQEQDIVDSMTHMAPGVPANSANKTLQDQQTAIEQQKKAQLLMERMVQDDVGMDGCAMPGHFVVRSKL